MANRRSSGGGRRGGSGIIFGVLAGLLMGLMIAATVAYYLKKSPLPFVDKVSRSPDKSSISGSVAEAPDPNAAFGNNTVGNPDVTAPIDVPKVSEQSVAPTASSAANNTPGETKDELGALIATLQPVPSNSNRVPSSTASSRDTVAKIEVPKSEPTKPADSNATSANGHYYLQVGSFKVVSEAETLRARLILMGVSSEIQQADVGGSQVHRVRVGPFSRLDEMNKVRTRLGEEKIPAVVVRQ